MLGAAGETVATEHDVETLQEAAPVQFIGSGATINEATENAFDRAGQLLEISEGEVRSRCTFSGGVEIARLPGVVQLSMLVPTARLEALGLADPVASHYGL